MTEFFSSVFAIAFLWQVVRTAIPYGFAALGGVVSERAGVIALALEAMLITGAFVASATALATGSLGLALLGGALGGGLIGGLYALCVVRLGADQIVSGVALNLLAYAGTRYLLKVLYGSTANSPNTEPMPRELLLNPLFYALLFVAGATVLFLARSVTGLRLRAVGEHPHALLAAGVRPLPLRAGAVVASGLLAGLGGAWLSLSNQGFVGEMSGGRGYIALAIVIMSGWRPGRALVFALLFSVAEALMIQLKTSAIGVPRELVELLPYVLTVVVLSGLIGRVRAPAALGKE